MKTLFPALRVSDVGASLAFYGVLGYEVVGQLQAGAGTRLAMPGGPLTVVVVDPDGYTLELVQWPSGHSVGMTRADFTHDPVPTDSSRDEKER
ncbi:MAG TPA: VOC family protein [Microlunatus sp.]